MTSGWGAGTRGAFRLPSGRRVRGRGLREPMQTGPAPTFGVYSLGRRPPEFGWETRWIRWPDFWLPVDRATAAKILREAWERCADERVEFACGAGKGRTGTALALLAIVDGLPASEAVAYVRQHYSPHAIETPGSEITCRTTESNECADEFSARQAWHSSL